MEIVSKEQKHKYNIVVVNFADSNYKRAQHINTKTALIFGKANVVYSFEPKDIEAKFYKEHKDILSKTRGAGMWLWKPYFVDIILSKLEEGEYLFYCDSGAFFIGSIAKVLDRVSDFDIFCCDIPLVEEQFTKKKTFSIIGEIQDKYSKTNQIIGTYFILRKTKFTVTFVKEWLKGCCNPDFLLPSDGSDEIEKFISHREDQSIFSLLCKKYNIESYKDISQRRWFPYSYKYDNCIFQQHDYKIDVPVVLYLHKMKEIKFYPLIRQLFHHLGSWFKHKG